MEMASEYVEEIERLSAENAKLRAEIDRLRLEVGFAPTSTTAANVGRLHVVQPAPIKTGPTYDEILTKFADGTATNATIRELLKNIDAKRSNRPAMEFISIEVKRNDKRPTGPIKLLGRTGPRSNEGFKITRKSAGQFVAHWRILDLRSWLETR
jgi:hypothetical protein